MAGMLWAQCAVKILRAKEEPKMDLLEELSRLFAYNQWANREALAALQVAGAAAPRSLKWMAHILAAEQLWEARLRQSASKVVVWPELTLEQCGAMQAGLTESWHEYLAALTGKDLSRTVDYVNTKGEAWSNMVGDILTHVVLHSAYHRGQIASDLRAAGQVPAYTDFIHWVREGLLE
jgi:uncharacterized damage-inducible protein DinB